MNFIIIRSHEIKTNILLFDSQGLGITSFFGGGVEASLLIITV